MHELALVQRILERAIEVACAHDKRAITAVTVDIGALQAVVPEAMEFAFEVASQGTMAEGAQFVWNTIPPRIACTHCDSVFEVSGWEWACSRCGAPGGRVADGDDIVLRSVELED